MLFWLLLALLLVYVIVFVYPEAGSTRKKGGCMQMMFLFLLMFATPPRRHPDNPNYIWNGDGWTRDPKAPDVSGSRVDWNRTPRDKDGNPLKRDNSGEVDYGKLIEEINERDRKEADQ